MGNELHKAKVIRANSGTYQHRFLNKIITVKKLSPKIFEQPYRKGNAGLPLMYTKKQLKFTN